MNLENKKQMATILLAVGLGLVAAFLTSQYVQNNVNNQTKALARDYQKKSSVLINELELMKRELKAVRAEQAQLAKQRAAALPLSGNDIQPVDNSMPFSLRTPTGKRALTIKIDTLSAVGGLVNPGDYVDIMAHLDVPEDVSASYEKERVTSVLFQKIQVLAVGIHFEPVGGSDIYRTQQGSSALNLTLALSPEEASLITFAQANGKLQLSLRSPTEEGISVVQAASWDTLSSFVEEKYGTSLSIHKAAADEEAPQKVKKNEKPSIQIFRAGREL